MFLKDTKVQPLFILCDVNMPKMGGIAFREAIYHDEELRLKCIPFLFLSTSADPKLIKEAYILAVQGYFKKLNTYAEIVEMFSEISLYWTRCLHPNS